MRFSLPPKVPGTFPPGPHRYLASFNTKIPFLKEHASQTQQLRNSLNRKTQIHSRLQSRCTNQLRRPEPEFGDKEFSELPNYEEDATEDFTLSPLQLDLVKSNTVSYSF